MTRHHYLVSLLFVVCVVCSFVSCVEQLPEDENGQVLVQDLLPEPGMVIVQKPRITAAATSPTSSETVAAPRPPPLSTSLPPPWSTKIVSKANTDDNNNNNNNNNNISSSEMAATTSNESTKDDGTFNLDIDDERSTGGSNNKTTMTTLQQRKRSVSSSNTTTTNLGAAPSGSSSSIGAEKAASTICPPGSTSDGVWGINRPSFNTDDFYFAPDPYVNTFGKWIRSDDRTGLLRKLCRRRRASNEKEKNDADDCEWGPKPEGDLNPFAGSERYWLNKTAAIYKQQQSSDSFSSSSLSFPSFCYDFQSARQCLAGRTIIFMGDSHLLNLAQTLCRMALKFLRPGERRQSTGPCGPLDVRFHKPMTVVYLPQINATIALLRVRYNLVDQMYRFYSHPWAKFLRESASVVVVGRGMWDLVYKDTPRQIVTREMTQALKYVAKTFAHARIVVKLVHYDHKFMWGCSWHDRMRQIRDANICAAYSAMASVGQENVFKMTPEERQMWKRAHAEFVQTRGGSVVSSAASNKSTKTQLFPSSPSTAAADPYSRFSIMDVFGMSREVPYAEATDRLGHHYDGSVMESMAQLLLNIMCPAQPQDHKVLFDSFRSVAKMSCDRILTNATTALRKPVCGCNDAMLARLPEGMQFCGKFLRRKNRVPYITDE